MFEAYIIYGSLMIIMILLANLAKHSYKYSVSLNSHFINPLNLLIVLIFAIVIGSRYNVGVDYLSYQTAYLNSKFVPLETEEGFALLNNLLMYFNAHYAWLFIITSFLQLYLIYIGSSKFIFLFPWIIFFYFTSLYLFVSQNGLRQCIAFSVLYYGVKFISDRKALKYFVTILIASVFHRSAILLMPLYFLNFNLYKKLYIQYLLLCIIFIFGQTVSELLWESIGNLNLGILPKYQHFITQKLFFTENSGAGIGIIGLFIVDILIIWYSDTLKNYFQKQNFTLFYNLYFTGTLVNYFANGAIVLERFNLYFINFRIVILSFLCYYLWNGVNARNVLLKQLYFGSLFFILAFFTLFFLRAIYVKAGLCAPFQFFFQANNL